MLLHRLNEAPLRRFWRATTSTWTRTGAEKGQGTNGVTLCRWKLGEVTLEINVPSSLWANCPPPLFLSFHLTSLRAWSILNEIVVLRKFSTCPRINAANSRLIPWEISMEDECWRVERGLFKPILVNLTYSLCFSRKYFSHPRQKIILF